MLSINHYTPHQKPSVAQIDELVSFLYQHLDEFGDPQNDIRKAADYALSINQSSPGGLILAAHIDNEIVGVVVTNTTGMSGYIPENILVYIATHKAHRGKGIGKRLMEAAIQHCKGDIALHVEPNNPATHLYESLGFTSKYLEMRLKK
jgi:ribosomal-protein-alanine N-acetyltransferase